MPFNLVLFALKIIKFDQNWSVIDHSRTCEFYINLTFSNLNAKNRLNSSRNNSKNFKMLTKQTQSNRPLRIVVLGSRKVGKSGKFRNRYIRMS